MGREDRDKGKWINTPARLSDSGWDAADRPALNIPEIRGYLLHLYVQ